MTLSPAATTITLKLLEKRGHQVRVVPNDLKATEAFAEERFDLVLMDVQMPEPASR